MPVWEGTYTDSDRVVSRLQESVITTDTPPPNSVTPIVTDALITMLGQTAEAELEQGLYSLGYALPLALSSTTTQRIMAAVVEKEIICQLWLSPEIKQQCCNCYSEAEISKLEKQCSEYCATLDKLLVGLENCSITLAGETKADHKPCDSVEKRVSTVPTTIAISSARSCTWRPPSQIRF